jgi:RNA polymerase sigma factor (sigma-70 family)
MAELVQRHLPLVYSAAMRRLSGDSHRSADVAQIVFVTLSRRAKALARHPSLTGWLYLAARNAAIDVLRSEGRRRIREQEAHRMQEEQTMPQSSVEWEKIRPVLDLAMDKLSPRDREAVLLRFFRGRSYREIGHLLGQSDDSARKCVDRAVERLRGNLERRGIVSTAAALSTLLAVETTLAAPPSLAGAVLAAVENGVVLSVAGTALVMVTKLQLGMVAALAAGAGWALIAQQGVIVGLRKSEASLAQQLSTMTAKSASTSGELGIGRRAVPTSSPAKAGGSISGGMDEATRTELHQRYDRFLYGRLGFTPAQAEKFVDLMIQKDDVRNDIQVAVEKNGLVGSSPAVQKLRDDLTAPIANELASLLGDPGYAEWREFEQDSFFRTSFVEPMIATFPSAVTPLTEIQIDQLSQVLAANNHPVPQGGAHLGDRVQIDWPAAEAIASGILTSDQMLELQLFGTTMKARGR